MDWDLLRYVLALSRHGTLSAAAKALGVTHTTVARRIKALEAELGTRVAVQSDRGFFLTEAGEALAAAATSVEGAVQDAERKVLGKDAELSGPLRLNTIAFFVHAFPEGFWDFVREHDQIELTIETSNELVSVSRRDADVVLRATAAPDPHLVGRKVGRLEFALYAAPELAARARKDGLEAVPWLGYVPHLRARLTEAWMNDNVPNAKTAVRLDSGILFQEALEAGVGVGFISCIAGDRSKKLERLRPVEPGFGMDIWALTHPDLRDTARVVKLIRFLADKFADAADAMAGRIA